MGPLTPLAAAVARLTEELARLDEHDPAVGRAARAVLAGLAEAQRERDEWEETAGRISDRAANSYDRACEAEQARNALQARAERLEKALAFALIRLGEADDPRLVGGKLVDVRTLSQVNREFTAQVAPITRDQILAIVDAALAKEDHHA